MSALARSSPPPESVVGEPTGGADPINVSIVVVSYNTREVLARCLSAVRQSRDAPSFEVLVVDNASVDGSAEMVAGRFPEVTLVESGRNLGFGKANNLAFAKAGGRYILVLNPDTEVEPDAIRQLVAYADAHPKVGAVGAQLSNADGSFQHSAFHAPDLRQAFFGFFDFIPLDSQLNGRYPRSAFDKAFLAEHLLGACLLLRRAAIEQVGAFDPQFFMYFEETDLCARLRSAGWGAAYTPSARVRHIGAASTSASRERMSVEFHRSQAYYYREHHGAAGYAALKLIVWLGTGYRLARSLRAYARGRIDRALLAERLAGYWRILWF